MALRRRYYGLHVYTRDAIDKNLYHEHACLTLRMSEDNAQALANAFQEQRFETNGKAYSEICGPDGKKLEAKVLK